MLIPLKSSLPIFVISNMSVPICNSFYAGRTNSGKITSFGVSRFTLSFEENLFTQRHEIFFLKVSVSPCLQSVPGCDGQTDKQTPEENYDS